MMNRTPKLRKIAYNFLLFLLSTAFFSSSLSVGYVQTTHAATDTYDSSGTWTAPTGVTSVTVEAWGGGGGGGPGNTGSGKGGGGGGAYVSSTLTVVPGNNYTVTVGAGGTPNVAGGDSSFTASGTVIAKGGQAGTATSGGNGGTAAASTGSTKFSGGGGGDQSGNGKGGGGGGGSAYTNSNGDNGTSSNSGGSGGSGTGTGGAGGSNNTNGGNALAPGGGGGGGGQNASSGNGANGRISFTYTPVVISVSITDGAIDYGGLEFGASANTTSSGLDDTQTATNDGSSAEDFNIRGQSSANWTIGATAGSEIYVHEFCTTGSGFPDPCDSSPTWSSMTTSYQSLASNVGVSSNAKVDFKITIPTSTATSNPQSVDITIQAVAN